MTKATIAKNPYVDHVALSEMHEDLYAWAYSLAGAQAEDVLQQAYVLVLEGKAVYRREATLKTWMFGVVKNVSRRMYRSAALRRTRDQQWAIEDVSDEGENEQLAAHERTSRLLITRAIHALPRKQREVLELHTYREFSLHECAHIMGLSIGSVRTHYHRAKVRLRTQLEQDA